MVHLMGYKEPRLSAPHHRAQQLIMGVEILSFPFSRHGALWSNISTLVSSVQKSCSPSRCSFVNLSPATILILEREDFLLEHFLAAILVQCFSNCPVMTFNLLPEACRV
ncbi:hypothetical protein GOODEAATRI_019674 [Goodea atripinnis]|uniref:Uncharacterized protein n=1 Tax=Goodea atripinnis TaxID=208336 RepID=A0ABV0N2R9_9TELE